METGIVVAAQLSSLFPSLQAASFVVNTSRQNAPLPPAPTETDILTEHASFSSSLHSPITGTILLRVLHGGLVLELLFLSSDIQPIRFVFPAIILPSPAIFWGHRELHILAVTDIGSLYRIVLPFSDGHQSWHDQLKGDWCREHIIRTVSGTINGIVQVQGTHCVAISLPNGSLLRLENVFGNEDIRDEWTETMFHHNSFLHSLTSFIPSLYSSNAEGSEIVSMASHPWPTDVGHIWTLSRDRVLRLWKAKVGCVSARTLSTSITGRSTVTTSPGPSGQDAKTRTFLEPGPQTRLRVFSTDSDDHRVYVLAFIPTSSSPTSGGIFHLFDTASDQLYEMQKIECSKSSAHCNLQDFLVSGGWLFTLWERQGQSIVECTTLQPGQSPERGSNDVIWGVSSHANQSELTPAYLEELLISSDSLPDAFLEAIMRPGMFSALTLRTAIDRYTDTCLSLPGPPPHQLTTMYSSLYENIAAVVGCTVTLMSDPQTGALRHTNYQNALKRDWEGFIARCREIEQNGRWPLALGTVADRDIVIIERERVGTLARKDSALTIRHHLEMTASLDPQQSVLELSWMLRSKLGTRLLLTMERNIVEALHQEIAVSFIDFLQDQAQRVNLKDELDEGLEDWILGRIQGIENIDQAIRKALDVIGGFDMEIKREEEEVELLLPPTHSDWQKAVTAAYITTTVEARYELCLSLFTLLFYLSDDLLWEPSLLAECFAVFRSVAMLRFISRQPHKESNGVKGFGDSSAADDVVTRLRNMHMSRSRSHVTPAYSLVHRLLSQSAGTYELPGAAHRFLDGTGILQSTSPAYSTKFEVLFCDRLWLLGCHDAAQEVLSWLPQSPGINYVLGRLWLSMGRADDASSLFEKLAGCFGPENAFLVEDEEALAAVLPVGELFETMFSFYLHASSLFKSALQVRHEVLFSQLALSVAPANVDCSSIWHSVISGNTELGLYDEAYASVMAAPYDKLKRESVGNLVYRMCENNAIENFMTFNFTGIAEEVEEALAFKARNIDPHIRPYYGIILHSWYVSRGDYRNAALTMYQRARKFRDLATEPSSFMALANEQLEAYLLAINCLSLLDQKNAWIVLPIFTERGEVNKRRRLTRYIPDDKYAHGKHDAEIVELTDMQYDYALLSAHLELLRGDPTMTIPSVLSLPPPILVLRLAQSNRFDMAFATARSLNVDMIELFAYLTSQCLKLSRDPDAVLQYSSDWLLTDKVSSWSGTNADRGWRYLRQALERHDDLDTDYKYTKTTFDTIVAFNGPTLPPLWLVRSLEAHDPEHLIRTYLRYEALASALEHTLSLIRKSSAQISREPPKNSFSTWLPYTLIDEVLVAANSQDNASTQVQALRQELNTEITNRVKRMQKLSHFSR